MPDQAEANGYKRFFWIAIATSITSLVGAVSTGIGAYVTTQKAISDNHAQNEVLVERVAGIQAGLTEFKLQVTAQVAALGVDRFTAPEFASFHNAYTEDRADTSRDIDKIRSDLQNARERIIRLEQHSPNTNSL